MTTRHLAGSHDFFRNKLNHKRINETLKAGLDLRHDCTFEVGVTQDPMYAFLRLSVGDDDYDMLAIDTGDVITTIAVKAEALDKYCSIIRMMLRRDTLDEILADLMTGQEESPLEAHQ